MKKSVLIRAALFCLLAVPVAAQVPAGLQEKIPLDGEVRVGRLDNGMTYYIRHYDNPKQRADFFIAHDVGALQEEDNQNGLAHFLEHMAFNGTKNFPGKGILNYLAANGVRFGYNVNAYTSRDRTVYNVSNVPLVREGLVDSLLLILHDWSYYISCEPDEIESERGVIREEWRRGNDARSRMVRKSAQVEYDGSKYARRDVIGDMDIVNNFERQTLVDFYHKWYRPDLQAVIVVGDVDVDAMERKIRDLMSSIPKAENPAPKEVYDIPWRDKPRYSVVTDPETKAVAVKLIFYQPYPSAEERATVGAVRDDLARKVFLEMARPRLAEAEKRPDVRYKRVVAVTGSLATCRNTLMLTALPREQDMREALAGILTDVEQMRRYGFSDEEFEAAKAKVAKAEEKALEKYRLATNTDLAGRYVEHFTRNVPYATPEDRTRIVEEQLDALTPEALNLLRAGMVSPKGMLVLVSSPEEYMDKVPSEADAFALIDSVKHAEIARPERSGKAAGPLFTAKITPGEVVKTRKAAFGAEEWTLSNGVKVFWRTVPEVIGTRKVGVAAINEGGFARDSDVEGMHLLQNYVRTMGVKDLGRSSMRDLLSSHDASLMATLGRDASSFSGAASAADFELLLQLLHLYITEPNFSEQAYGDYLGLARTSLGKEKSPKALFAERTDSTKYGGHPWLRRATLSTLDRFDREAARKLYDKLFGNAADFVFFFAGEMPAGEARPLIEKYIGSLPAAPKQKFKKEDFEIVPGTREYDAVFPGAVTPKSSIERIYHGKFDYTPANYAALRYVSYILGARYLTTVREEKGGTYYIGVHDEVGARPRGYCHLVVSFETDPKLREMLLGEVQKGIEQLAAEAPSEQEVNEAMLYFKKVNAERKSKNLKSTSYWINKMRAEYFDGADLDKDNEAVFTAVTPEEVRRLTREILAQGNRYTAVFTQE